MNVSVSVLETPDASLDSDSLEFLASARWSARMTMLLLGIALLCWLNFVLLMSGGWASTSGAVFTASGAAMFIAAGGQALVRGQAGRLSSAWRSVGIVIGSMLLSALGAGLVLLLSV